MGEIIISAQDETVSTGGGDTFAPLASPAFTGTPTAPTAVTTTNTTQIATTAFVQQELGSLSANSITDGDSSISITDAGTGTITMTVDAATQLTINASTADFQDNAITTTGVVSGIGSGLTSLTAANIDAGNLGSGVVPYTTASSTASNFKVTFANTTGNTSGNFVILMDSDGSLTYNPSTNTLSTSTISTAFTYATTIARSPTVTSSLIGISGSTNGATGSNLQLYGSTHATQASDVEFRVGTSNILAWDNSLSNWTMAGDLTLSAGNILPSATSVLQNIGSPTDQWTNVYAAQFHGVATKAQYADLAENYVADAAYEEGTVLSFGGENEVTLSTIAGDKRIAGIVSTAPAHLMNSAQMGDFVTPIALSGRAPCKVTGTVRKGDMMVSNGDGTARAEENPQMGQVIGKALEDFDGETGLIEVVVGRL